MVVFYQLSDLSKSASGRKGNAAQHLPKTSFANGEETFIRGDGWVCVLERIEHQHELIRIRASVTISAYGCGDGPNSGVTTPDSSTGNVAESIRRWRPWKASGRVVSGRIVSDVIRHAKP